MSFFDRMERRFGWLAFPGFLRYYALFHVLVFVLQLFQPDISRAMEFDREKVLGGEVWRVVTVFFANSQFGRPGLLTLLFLYFAIQFVFMVSDSLEGAWGSFKTSVFYYTGMLGVLIANFAYPQPIPASGMMLYASAFLAFATLFPKVQILLFMILPVQVRFLGMFVAAGLLLQLISSPIQAPFFVLALFNYAVWAGIPAVRGTARLIDASKRRQRFNAKKLAPSEAFHTCAVCQRTEVGDPYLEFRIGRDGEEYCVDHLPDDSPQG